MQASMKFIRVTIGMALILCGMGLGIAVTLYYFAEGILYIKAGHLREGLILLLLWSEVLGIVSTLALVIPGVLLLRNLGSGEPARPGAAGAKRVGQ
jgi:hypothetical protein